MGYTLKALNTEISNGALGGKSLPKAIKIMSWGKNDTVDGPVYLDERTLSVFSANQLKAGRNVDVPLDFDHCTVPGSKEYVPGKPKSIAAYGTPVIKQGDGLYLEDLEWTPLGEKNARNYKDLSPTALVDKHGSVIGLHSAALTPTGAVYGLKFYSTEKFDDMITKMSAEKEVKPLDAEIEPMAIDDQEALKKTKELEEHEKAEIKDLSATPDEYGILHHPDCMCARCSADQKISDDSKESAEDTTTKTTSLSASFPDAYKAQIPHYNTMNDTIVKKMAAELATKLGLEKSDTERVLFAFLAEYKGLEAEQPGQITKKENTEEGGLKQFSAELKSLKDELQAFKAEKIQTVAKASEFERKSLVEQASKEGKVLPLSAEDINTIDLGVLRSIVTKMPKTVPMNSTMRVLSAQPSTKPSREKAISAFDSMLKNA